MIKVLKQANKNTHKGIIMFRNILNKFMKFVNGNVAVLDSPAVEAPVMEVSYPFITELVDNGWDYVRPMFIRSPSDVISGYPISGEPSRIITFSDGITAETHYEFWDNITDQDVTAEFTFAEYEEFAKALGV